MVAESEFYRELECEPQATPSEIRSQFRRLARQYHPDLNPKDPDAAERFRRITAAYNVLSDPSRREQYDRYGHVVVSAGFDPDRVRAAQAADALPLPAMPVTVSFIEAVRGGTKHVGLDDERQRHHGLPSSLDVRIPPGLQSGATLQLAPRPPAREPLILQLRVAPHPLFRREGRDVVYRLPVSLTELLAGTALTLPTPCGTVPFVIRAGAEPGSEYRIRGHGVAASGRLPPGDLRVHIRLVMPSIEGRSDAKALLARIDELYDGPVRDGWFQTAEASRSGSSPAPRAASSDIRAASPGSSS